MIFAKILGLCNGVSRATLNTDFVLEIHDDWRTGKRSMTRYETESHDPATAW
jgi:hypothetical protein